MFRGQSMKFSLTDRLIDMHKETVDELNVRLL